MARPFRVLRRTFVSSIGSVPAVAASLGVVSLICTGAAVAQVSTTGDASPTITTAPVADLTGQRILLGSTQNGVGKVGSLDVTNGGVMAVAQIVAGWGGLGTGTVNVTGAGSSVLLTGGASSNGLDIGSWGTGSMTVSNGGQVQCPSTLGCAFNDIGNAAGSVGTLSINAGAVGGLGRVAVGNGNLLQGFGTPGANTSGTLSISNGGTLSSYGISTVAQNSGQTGLVTGTVSISGAGSSWSISRDLPNGGGQAGLNIANAANTIGTVTISGGGLLSVAGSRANPATDSSVPVINIGTAANAVGTVDVSGAGSRLQMSGDSPLLQVGRFGGTGALNISNGGRADTLLLIAGRDGGIGTVTVSGAGALLNMVGVGAPNTQGIEGIGAALFLGNTRNGPAGGNGTLNVLNGGKVFLSDGGAAATALGGLVLGSSANTSGSAVVSGLGSSIVVNSGNASSVGPRVLVGGSGTGQMTVTNNAIVSVEGVSGQARNFVVGGVAGGIGNLLVSNGAQIMASRLAVGDLGGAGTATISNASVKLDGNNVFNGQPVGANVHVGRGDGAVGALTMQNSASIQINSPYTGANVSVGGSGSLAGGSGTLSMSGGSTISFTGTGTNPQFRLGYSGTGAMNMSGGSVVTMGSNGSFVVGVTAAGNGTLNMSGGSTVNAGQLFGLSHDGTANTGGTSRAIVNQSTINATNIVVGTGGYLGGNGLLNGHLTMAGGTFNPGNSPGRMVVNGGFDFLSGLIVLEVESDGHGGFLTDQIVFTQGSVVDLAHLNVEFAFLGATDPTAFLASGLWGLDTFFKTNDLGGDMAGDHGISALLGPGQTLNDLFLESIFGARSEAFAIAAFEFTPDGGVGNLQVPVPGTLWLFGAAVAAVGVARRGHHRDAARRSRAAHDPARGASPAA